MSELEETTTDETTTTEDSADETATSDSPADDASSSAESSAEEQVEETPEQKVEREKAARIQAAEQEEKRAEDARKERLKIREQAEREERVVIREREAERTLHRAQAMLDDLEKRADAVRRGGYDALKALGIDYGDWTKKTLEETGPEALATKALREAEEVKAELRRRDERDEARKAEAAAETVKKRFESFVDESADDFPDAATLTPRVLHLLAQEASTEYRRENGAWPSFTALLPRLDKKAKEFHDEQKKRSAKRTRSSDSPSDGATTTPQATTNGQPANAPANRTLTPATATTRATPRRQMTPEEEDEWALAELRQAMAVDSKRAV